MFFIEELSALATSRARTSHHNARTHARLPRKGETPARSRASRLDRNRPAQWNLTTKHASRGAGES